MVKQCFQIIVMLPTQSNGKNKFTKKQKMSGILSNLRSKPPLSKIPLVGDILF